MKLMYISNFYPPNVIGGAEKIAAILAETMASRGHQVSVITLAQDRHHSRKVVNGVSVHSMPIRNVYGYAPYVRSQPPWRRAIWHTLDAFNPLAASEVGHAIEEERPDIVHSHNVTGFSAAIWPKASRQGFKCVHSIHDYYLMCSRNMLFKKGRNCEQICGSCRLLSFPRRLAVKYLNAVVAPSRAILEKHQDILRNVPLRRVIRYGIITTPTLSKERCERSERPFTIGFLGRIQDSKGIELLLSEFREFRQDHSPILLIGGTGDTQYVDHLKNKYQDPRIRFLGFVDSQSFMRRIDVAVVPSVWQDPYPVVALEALSHGVPVVASRRGGLPESIRDGVNGVTFDPNVSGDLALALRRSMKLRLADGSHRSTIATSLPGLSAASMCDSYEDLYSQLRDIA